MNRNSAVRIAILVVLTMPLIVGCKEKSPDKAPQEGGGTAAEPAPVAVVDKAEPAQERDAAAAKPEPAFPEKEFEGTPLQEEGHRTIVQWNDKNTSVAVCDQPGPDAVCKQLELKLKLGQELKYDETYLRVVPRILVAKDSVEFELGGAALKAGDKLALYRYVGEGTCAVATARGYFDGDRCPDEENFSNMPSGEGSTAEVMLPQSTDWWIKVSAGCPLKDSSSKKRDPNLMLKKVMR